MRRAAALSLGALCDAESLDLLEKLARRLADPIESIEMSNLPLADFVQLVTDMTAVPITLDPAALPAIKVSPHSPGRSRSAFGGARQG